MDSLILRESSGFLTIISNSLFIVVYLVFSLFILKIWHSRKLGAIFPLVYSILGVFLSLLFYRTNNEVLAYAILLGLKVTVIYFFVDLKFLEALFLGIFDVFHFIFCRLSSISLVSLIKKKNMYQVIEIAQLNQMATISTVFSMILIFSIYYIIVDKEKYKCLFTNKILSHFVISIYSLMLLFMIYNGSSIYYNLNLINISIFQLFSSILIYTLGIIIFLFCTKLANMLQYNLKNKLNLSSLDFQNSIYTEIKKNILNIENNLPTLNFEKYTDIETINVLLYQYKLLCANKNINFKAEFNILNLDKFDYVKLNYILNTLLINSYEACLKSPKDSEKFIILDASFINNELSIKITNSFFGKRILINGIPYGYTVDDDLSGFGIPYVMQICKSLHGNLDFSIDNTKLIFIAKLKFDLDYNFTDMENKNYTKFKLPNSNFKRKRNKKNNDIYIDM